MENMRLIKKSRRVSLAIVWVILIGRFVTAIVYTCSDLMEHFGFYGNIEFPSVLEVAIFVLMLLDYLMLKQIGQEEKNEENNPKNNQKIRRILIEIIGIKSFLVFYFFLMSIRWILDIIMGYYLFDAYGL